jgi:predicted acylesterase/phospholipase RssA
MDFSNIKCIVISGGGSMLYQMLGILYQLIKSKKINIDNITHFYGSSSGAILSLVLSLGIEIETLNKYFIDRPWDKLVKTDIFQILHSFTSCGIISKDFIISALEPLYKSKDIDINCTMSKLYELTKKEIHILATNITDGICEDISYKTHPDWSVIDAIHASICIPTVVEPLIKNNKCYVDGCVVTHFPIKNALDIFDKNEIIGIKTKNITRTLNKDVKFNNILEFLYYMVEHTHHNFVSQSSDISNISNIFIISRSSYDMVDIFNVINSKDKRLEYFNEGKIIYADSI